MTKPWTTTCAAAPSPVPAWRQPTATAAALVLCLLPPTTHAQETTAKVPSVVITATRIATPAFDVPASIDSIDSAQIRDGRLQVNLSESLGSVPGLQARDRQNYAQDVQISVRGFGARSTFGIRGVRLYVDGIPATLPDGQGQLSNVDLGSAERIEILRGPFSALYGNSSGGVIQVFTADGQGAPTLSPAVAAGSDGTARVGVKLGGSAGSFAYTASTSLFETDGYRQHSAARRRIGNVKLGWTADDDTRFKLIVNSVALPLAQDPLGLTRAQFSANPRGVDASAETFNTRKTVEQTQLGLIAERRVGDEATLQLMVYGGQRDTEQFQSIPVATQANPLHPGGVIQLARNYRGVDLRGTWAATAQRPLSVVAGVAYDSLQEHRVGRQNFVGTTLGIEGALRRDEDNHARSLDPYVQIGWQITPSLNLNAGLRRSSIRFESADHYIVGSNPDDSGAVRYAATLPVLGLVYALSPDVRIYTTAGRGFETPTLNELAYRSDGSTGLNLRLRPAKSDNAEVGLKMRSQTLGELRMAWFGVRTADEIVTLSNVGGRSSFTNSGASQRQGLEAAWALALAGDIELRAAYTFVNARYRDAFATCTATPCAAANFTVAAGNRIPGIAQSTGYASLAWAPAQGWRGGLEARASSRVFVNDANNDAAAGFATASAHLGYLFKIGDVEWTAFGRIDNLFARKYAGSVIVNEGNARYFEPAPARTWIVAASGSLRF